MTKPVSLPSNQEPISQPNDVQLARLAALRRFNWFYVYTPLILTVLFLGGIVVYLLYGTVFLKQESLRQTVSGLADLIIISLTLPMILLCAIVPGAAVGFAVYRRNKQKETAVQGQPAKPIQAIFWRIENIVDRVQAQVQTTTPKIAQPIISLNALLEYMRVMYHAVIAFLRRS